MAKKQYIGALKKLPDGYTQVEYIQSSGTQYINTGITATNKTTAKYKFSLNAIKTYGPHILSGAEWFFPMFRTLAGSTFVAHRGGTYVENTVMAGAVGVDYEVDAFANNKVIINGVDCGTVTSGSVAADSRPLHLLSYGGSPSDSNYTVSGKLYYCKIWEDGTLVRDFIPCVSNTGAIGLYDLQNGVFYTNAGTGTFTAGSTVENAQSEVARLAKKAYFGVETFEDRGLPSEYTQVAYIQSSGTQYINTGCAPSNTLKVAIKLTPISSGMSEHAILGSSWSANGFFLMFYQNMIRWHSKGASVDVSNFNTTGENEIICTQTSISVNGTNYSLSGTGADSSSSIMLFGKMGYTAGNAGIYKLHSCKIYDNGTLVRDFVPCASNTGAIGLYDLVGKQFYANAGSSTFAAGPTAGSVARRIKRAYIGDENNIARMFLGGVDIAGMVIGYTGAFTDQKNVVMSGKTYRLLTLTGSGTLTLPQEVIADVWMCAGGNGGASGGRGGGGGVFNQKDKTTINGSVVCTVGSGGSVAKTGNATAFGASSISNGSIYYQGASGGGGGGTGGGKTTVPFGSSDYFSPHSAGGGGGGSSVRYTNGNTVHYRGGAGGSNGANGAANTSASGWPSTKAAGGNLGGGAGGSYDGNTATAGSKATYYGSGGGGGGSYKNEKTGSVKNGGGGAGYQGVIYVRIPYEQ